MQRNLQEQSTVSFDEENRVLARDTEAFLREALSSRKFVLPPWSRQDTLVQVACYAQRIRQLEADRRRPHKWELVYDLAKTKAVYLLMRWRLFRINDFPVEIIQRIFELVVASPTFPEISKSRIKLASVCSYWRSIVINTAKLWSDIVINMRPPFHLFRLSLQRAKAHPLTLFVDQKDPNWTGSENHHRLSPKDMRALMSVIASCLDQVRTLIIHADTWAVIGAAEEILQSAPPPRQLQRLEIRRTGKTYVQFIAPARPPPGITSPFRLFGGRHAPTLKHISFSGLYIDFAPASFRDLCVFEMRKMAVEQMPTLSDFLPVLQASPRLERLVFDSACPQLTGLGSRTSISGCLPIQLAYLRDFELSSLTPDYAIYILQVFQAPGLKRLTLERLLHENYNPFVLKLIGKFPEVTVLTVNGLGATNTGDLVAWLRTMRVRYLRVARVANEFFEALATRAPVYPVDPTTRVPGWDFVCSRLESCEILLWTSIGPAAFKKFCSERRSTLRRILISQAAAEGIQSADKTWLVKTGILNFIPPGALPHLDERKFFRRVDNRACLPPHFHLPPSSMSTTEQPGSEAKISRSSYSSKEKGKENPRKSDRTGRNALKGVPVASSEYGAEEEPEGDEAEWPWMTLAESNVCSRPPVFTIDGNYFFSIIGAAVRIYSVATGKVVSTLSSSSMGSSASRVTSGEGHSDVITSAILNPENPFQLLTASLDGDIKIWDFLDAVLLQTIHVGRPISHMCSHGKFKGQVFIAVPTKLKKFSSQAHDKGNTMIYRISLTPRESTSSQHTKPSEIVRVGKTKATVSMGISPSGSWLVVIAGHKAYVSPTSSPESGFTKFVSPEKLTSFAFHPIEDYFATGDEKGHIRLWYCLNDQMTANTAGERRAQTTTMHWHAHALTSLSFTRNGAYLLSGGEESVLVIWQLQSGKKEFLPRLGSPILNITVRTTDEGEEYLLGLADGTYLFINPGSLSVSRSISRIRLDPKGMGRPPHTPVPLTAHSRTSTLILPASYPSSLQIFSPSTSELSELEISSSNRVSRRDTKDIEAARVDFVAVSPSGDWMATIDVRDNEEEFSAEMNLKIWQWDSLAWSLNTRIDRPHGSKKIVAIGFSPLSEGSNDGLLMTVGLDGNVKIWCKQSINSKTGLVEDFWINRSNFTFRNEVPSDACWSPDGSALAVCFGRQIALYDPYTSHLLDCLTTMDVRNIWQIRFVGKSGRYVLASGRNNIVLWDLVTRAVRWHYYTYYTVAQALAHPVDDLVCLVVQPYAEDSAIRTSKVLHFGPNSSEPLNIRSLPFRFRAVHWNPLDNRSHSLIGITYSWNVVLCGSDAYMPGQLGDAARQIDLAAGVAPKRTLFQDIFGKSAFTDRDVDTKSRSSTVVSSENAIKSRSGMLYTFDVPAFQAPPIETLYSSLMEGFLAKAPEQEEPAGISEDHDGTDDMIVDTEPVQNISQRVVEDAEISSLVELFKGHSVNRTAQVSPPNTGVVNGVHKMLTNGTYSGVSRSRASTPKTPHASEYASNGSLKSTTAPKQIPGRSSPVATGKKRKKSTS
ncbi:uncharacterized protein FOMMEDRAFT_167102 [Fomitiporia mediterranea MF3/22]|uniref:uncharacterized protein n=1 Tax=Fomitiporia mediterranea (strain MF3/22) TaxID=694068 RepID=UPI0004407CED|nr:uncharacterized protein FOMMEDRAFT_167102 [Fomitiporia mediterranea MF3/22]EJD03775.1 hypothetical protein FOMMEDRAFT_167102 [Fomitiporia mediterranea MF3/22]